jgi:hypothetical protein
MKHLFAAAGLLRSVAGLMRTVEGLLQAIFAMLLEACSDCVLLKMLRCWCAVGSSFLFLNGEIAPVDQMYDKLDNQVWG